MVGHADFNVPHAMGKTNCEDICNTLTLVNDTRPGANCSLIVMPDNPRASSLRGLHDEEKQIADNMWENKQFCDVRWIELFERTKSSDAKSNSKKFGFGRIVVNFEAMQDNPWLLCSELAVAGRPVGELAVHLPKGHELLVPVAESPDKDISLNDRFRPSPEQAAAQKGARRMEIQMISLFRNMVLKGPVILLSTAGYVEDLGSAVYRLVKFENC